MYGYMWGYLSDNDNVTSENRSEHVELNEGTWGYVSTKHMETTGRMTGNEFWPSNLVMVRQMQSTLLIWCWRWKVHHMDVPKTSRSALTLCGVWDWHCAKSQVSDGITRKFHRWDCMMECWCRPYSLGCAYLFQAYFWTSFGSHATFLWGLRDSMASICGFPAVPFDQCSCYGSRTASRHQHKDLVLDDRTSWAVVEGMSFLGPWSSCQHQWR